MRVSQLLVTSALLLTEAFAAPHVKRVQHEKRHESAKKWVKRDRLHSKQIVPVRIGMTQSRLDDGHDHLMTISHPDSPHYGNWLTSDEVVDFFAPAKDTVDAVRDWLVEAGVEAKRITHSANKQWLQFDSPVEELESLLDTKYHFFEQPESGKVGVACDSYHVPEHLAGHIDYVTPGVKLMATKKPEKRTHEIAKRGAGMPPNIIGTIAKSLFGNLEDDFLLTLCDQYVTPPCIRKAYNFTEGTKAAKGNEIGIFEEGDVYAAEDLAEFFALFAQEIPVTTQPKIDAIDGALAPSVVDPTVESDLDFQLAYPIVYPQQAILFQTDDIFYSLGIGTNSTGFFNSFLDAIDGSYCIGKHQDTPEDPYYPDPNPLGYQGNRQCGVYKPTHVVSVSYGEQEDDLPTNYQTRQCAEFMKLAMQGTTIFIASGDSGVAARGADDGNADGCLGKGQVFNPDFPTSCPYAVSVGATLLTGNVSQDVETAVTRFPSGGGFSNVYPRPSWQNDAVNNYLTNHKPSYPSYNLGTVQTNNPTAAQTGNGIYNAGGRGYPDVSAIGDNVVVINDGTPTLVGGTSAACPIWASLINRINEERIAVGKGPVGFIQPTLYQNPGAFHDITVGNNSGCGTPGFYAAPGWDPVTGLGTPNYPKLLEVFMKLN